ncbi:hypothetical protein ACWDUH_08335 [Micromonospora wenchangensis]|uniref:Uncharacterized protein n=1 Tax=Micromonospora wenchangensis TaxID=1185415 RepID=A0A246RJZ0_9ACTN|nr:hypothetical protein B5D80_17765 [Micromonospora wenchangensis]
MLTTLAAPPTHRSERPGADVAGPAIIAYQLRMARTAVVSLMLAAVIAVPGTQQRILWQS